MLPKDQYFLKSEVSQKMARFQAEAAQDKLLRACKGGKPQKQVSEVKRQILQSVKQGELSVDEGLHRLNRLEKA